LDKNGEKAQSEVKVKYNLSEKQKKELYAASI